MRLPSHEEIEMREGARMRPPAVSAGRAVKTKAANPKAKKNGAAEEGAP